MKTFRHDSAACWHCGKERDSLSGVAHHHRPRPGQIAICFGCGQPSIITADLGQRKPTDDEWLEIGADKQLQRYLVFMQADIRTRGPHTAPR